MTMSSSTTGCVNPAHDHTTTVDRDGVDLVAPIAMLCNGCGVPTHYDATLEDYVHDAGPGCFLALPAADGSPCRPTVDGHHFDRLRDDVPETCECGARFGNPGDFHIDVVKAAHLRAHGIDVIDVERVSVHDTALAMSSGGEADHAAAYASLAGKQAVFITCERDEIVGTLEAPTGGPGGSGGYMVIRFPDGMWGRADDEILLVK
jgi:hypothetical protein